MREQVDFSKYPKLENILNITKEVLPASIGVIISTELAVMKATMEKMDPKDIFGSYENQVLITADESNSNSQLGFLFQLADITFLSDIMLGGDGDTKTELDIESKDAIKELASQLISSLNVPYETSVGSGINIKIDNIVINNVAEIFTSIDYFVINFSVKMASKSFDFAFYFDHGFEQYISAETSFGFKNENENPQALQHQGSMNLDLLLDIDIPLSVRMGTAKLFLKDILGLGPGNIVELEQNADEPIELTVNDKVIARGEVVIVDGYFGFRIKEIISRAERIRRLRD